MSMDLERPPILIACRVFLIGHSEVQLVGVDRMHPRLRYVRNSHEMQGIKRAVFVDLLDMGGPTNAVTQREIEQMRFYATKAGMICIGIDRLKIALQADYSIFPMEPLKSGS